MAHARTERRDNPPLNGELQAVAEQDVLASLRELDDRIWARLSRDSQAILRRNPVISAWELLRQNDPDKAFDVLESAEAWGMCPRLEVTLADRFISAHREGRALHIFARAVHHARSPAVSAELGFLLLARTNAFHPASAERIIEKDFREYGGDRGLVVWSTMVPLWHVWSYHRRFYVGQPASPPKHERDKLVPYRYVDDAVLTGPPIQEHQRRAWHIAEKALSRASLFYLNEAEHEAFWEQLFSLFCLAYANKQLGNWKAVKDIALNCLSEDFSVPLYRGNQEELVRMWVGDEEENLRIVEIFHGLLREAISKLPGDRAHFEEICAKRWREFWSQLNKHTRSYLVSAEIEKSHRRGDSDWSSPVNEYCKAAESALRFTLGIFIDNSPERLEAQVLRKCLNAKGSRVSKFQRIVLSTWANILVCAQDQWIDAGELAQGVKSLNELRGRAAHADSKDTEVWKVAREEAERAELTTETILRQVVSLSLVH